MALFCLKNSELEAVGSGTHYSQGWSLLASSCQSDAMGETVSNASPSYLVHPILHLPQPQSSYLENCSLYDACTTLL